MLTSFLPHPARLLVVLSVCMIGSVAAQPPGQEPSGDAGAHHEADAGGHGHTKAQDNHKPIGHVPKQGKYKVQLISVSRRLILRLL